ncbi:phage tail protein [Caldalkalibacillus horti]|uniref:Phage tail-like protein n=1 Tax=Caldalkalibacillus horti TaxID=77523 RepID=A0ABT9VZZ3_9BACI|nr:phage tail protein [Bacillus horti]MDQ0166569.1 phage tail-like protein [Bacillus horti]
MEQRFFSYNKGSDWKNGKAYNVMIHGNELSVEQQEKYSTALILRFALTEVRGRVTDFSLGERHQIHLLDEEWNIWSYDWQNHYQEILFQAKDYEHSPYTMIDSVQSVLFLADPLLEDKLSAYSTINGQKIWAISQWNQRKLYPLAIHSDHQKGLYVLVAKDMVQQDGKLICPSGTRLSVLHIESTGRILKEYGLEGLFINAAFPLTDPTKQFSLAASPEGIILLYHRSTGILYRISNEKEMQQITSLEQGALLSSIAVDGEQTIFMGGTQATPTHSEEERFILKLHSSGERQDHVAAFRGSASKMRMDSNQRLYVLNKNTNELHVLERRKRTNFSSATSGLKGIFLTTAFDSTEDGLEWHKVQLEAHIPDETQIRISYFASDRKDHWLLGHYRSLDEWILSDTDPIQVKCKELEGLWQGTLISPRDALLFKAKGRYLWVKIEFIGSEFKTPVLNRLRVYFPRQTYLPYLPAVYQEEDTGQDFLARYLALFHTLFTEVEEEINQLPTYLDADVVTGPFLSWLSTWLGISSTDRWSEQQLRSLIKLAPELYPLRGTKFAMQKMIELFTGKPPIIVEYHQYKEMRKDQQLGQIIDRLYGSNPYTFTVLIEQNLIKTERERFIVERIIEEEKPAFTEGKLVLLEENIYLDMHSYIGMNTILTEPSLLILDQQAAMPHQTLLIDQDLANRLDTHTRLGLDSELE